MAIRPLHHPDIATVTVRDILHALADPARLEIVAGLLGEDVGLNCTEVMDRLETPLAKSTCSQHFQILRSAGIVVSERNGVELSSRLRLAELEAKFPGLMDAILKTYQEERSREKSTRGTEEMAQNCPQKTDASPRTTRGRHGSRKR